MTTRRRLDRSAVVQRAVEMANAAGDINDLTLAELAASLGIKTPSLYNHVDGLPDLQRELARYAWRHLGRAVRHGAAGQTGRKALIYLAHAYRRFAHDNPGIYPLILGAATEAADSEITEIAEEILSTLLLVFASAGIEGEAALHAVRGYRSLLHGFVSLEMTGGFAMPLEIEKSFDQAVRGYIGGVLDG